jgi:hypothetical protein
MYRMLFAADLVIADLSTANPNALFELGVRHALKPKSTIIIAESQFRNPFDVNHIVIIPYMHLGIDIGYSETIRMQDKLRTLALAVKSAAATDSPVYIMLPGLQQPTLGETPSPDASQIKASAIDDKGTYVPRSMSARNMPWHRPPTDPRPTLPGAMFANPILPYPVSGLAAGFAWRAQGRGEI